MQTTNKKTFTKKSLDEAIVESANGIMLQEFYFRERYGKSGMICVATSDFEIISR
jgi:hypothetical protein